MKRAVAVLAAFLVPLAMALVAVWTESDKWWETAGLVFAFILVVVVMSS